MSAPTLVQKLSNVKHMPVLMAATSATKDPADNFLVKDIIILAFPTKKGVSRFILDVNKLPEMSYESPQTRIFLQQYLVNQLITSSNVYTKLKVLRLFVDLLEEGHIEFKQNLRKTPEPFNEAIKLRPHLYNDQKMMSECGRIRDMASKVLDLLYMDAPELRRHPTSDTMSSSSSSDYRDSSASRITGFGSSDSGSSRSSSSTTTDRLKSLFGSSSNKTDTLVYDPSYATMDPVPHNVSSSQSAFTVDVPTRTSQVGGSTPPVGVRHEKGQAGGGWGGDDRKSTSNQWSSSRGMSGREGMGGRGGVVTDSHSSTSYENSGIEQEQMLVDKILAPGGVRVAPPREDLNKFISRCKVLDCQSVVECLRLKLSAEETNTVLRALFIMESLLRSDVPDVVSHFDLALQDLTDLTSSTNSSIKAKANKILMLLASSQRPPASSSSSKVAATQQLTSSGDDDVGEEEDDEDGGEGGGNQSEGSQGLASIFSGLSVSGEKTQRPKQQPKKKAAKRPTPAASKKATQPSASPAASSSRKVQQRSGFEDILGLGDLSSESSNPAPQQPQQPMAEEPSLPLAMQQGLAETQEDPPPEDNSLLTFEEDVEFDPLKRSGSIHRSDSLGPKSAAASMSLSSTGYATQPALLDQQQLQPLPPTIAPMTTADPPLSSSNPATSASSSSNNNSSAGQFGDLSGISLDLSSGKKKPAQKRQESLGELYQMAQATSGANVATPKSVGVAYPAPGMVPMVSAAPPGVQVPLGLQGGMVYGGGVVPVMYAPQGAQGVMYHQPQFGGVSRPVQIASSSSSKDQSASEDTGFSFIGKSSKTSAFDFVQDEMKASNAKK